MQPRCATAVAELRQRPPPSGGQHTARRTEWATVSQTRSRVQVLTRRWIAAVCVMAAAGATVVLWRIDEQTQPCHTVRALIDFNRTTQDSLKAKTYMPPAGSYDEPKVPTEADYRAWTDGMQQRADRVTDSGLAVHAHRLAELAREYLSANTLMNTQLNQQPVGEPSHGPPAAKEVVKTNREFTAELRALNQACPHRSS